MHAQNVQPTSSVNNPFCKVQAHFLGFVRPLAGAGKCSSAFNKTHRRQVSRVRHHQQAYFDFSSRNATTLMNLEGKRLQIDTTRTLAVTQLSTKGVRARAVRRMSLRQKIQFTPSFFSSPADASGSFGESY